MKNKMFDLRNHLFEVIERLKDGDIDVKNAKAINEVAKTLNDTAITELKYIQEGLTNPTSFLQGKQEEPKKIE